MSKLKTGDAILRFLRSFTGNKSGEGYVLYELLYIDKEGNLSGGTFDFSSEKVGNEKKQSVEKRLTELGFNLLDYDDDSVHEIYKDLDYLRDLYKAKISEELQNSQKQDFDF